MMRKDDFKTCKTFQGFQFKNIKTKINVLDIFWIHIFYFILESKNRFLVWVKNNLDKSLYQFLFIS